MDSHLVKCLKEMEAPIYYNITAEKALQFFSYPCFSLAAYKKEDDEPYLIFKAYMKFIRNMPSDARVDGIWEDILRKTLKYSQHFSISYMNKYNDNQMIRWLDSILSSRDKCPNPYIRLELFRLSRVIQGNWGAFDWCYLTDTFIHTICEIQPCLLYPSGNEDDMLFDVIDMQYIMILCCKHGNLKQMISTDIVRFVRKSGSNLHVIKESVDNKINYIDSNEIMFIVHLIQLIGVFAVMNRASSTIYRQQIKTLRACLSVFREIICDLVDCGDTFRILIKAMPFHEYVAETIRDLTSAVTNLKKVCLVSNKMLWSHIDEITGYLGYTRGYFTEPCDLPSLLLNRQIHGSTTHAWQYSLYLRKLEQTYNVKNIFLDENDDSSEDELWSFPSENSSSNEFNEDSENSSSRESNDNSENRSNDEISNDSDN